MSGALMDFLSNKQWVAWKNEERGGNWTKAPYVAPDRRAKADDPTGWLTHDGAAELADTIVDGDGGGIGIQLGECGDIWLAGVDLDTCRDPVAGVIEPWAQAVIDRFDTYCEVSPSGTGVKLFLRINPAEISQLRSIMGTLHGRQFKRANGAAHPPAIELHVSHRYFAVTWHALDDAPTALRQVPLEDLRWLVEDVGPVFAGKTKPDPTDTDGSILARLNFAASHNKAIDVALRNAATMKGGSRSEGAFCLGVALRRAGWSFGAMKDALLACPATKEWATEKQAAEGDRQFERIWQKGAQDQPAPSPADPTAALVPSPWTYRDPTAIPPREWLVGTSLMRGYATVLASAGGVGKTALAIALALAFITGRKDILDQHVFQTGKVWFITLEDDRQELERRVAAAMLLHKISSHEVEGWLFINGEHPLILARADTNDAFAVCEENVDAVIDGIKTHGVGLTIIDPLVKAHRAIENSNEHMDQLQTLANSIASRTHSSVLLLAHFRKGGGEDGARDAIRGGGALVDGARIARTLMPMTSKEADTYKIPEDDAFRYVRITDAKRNLAPKDKAQWIELVSVPLNNREINPAYPNGDNVQAAEAWRPPSALDGLDGPALQHIFDRLRQQPEPGYFYSSKPQAKFWAGTVIMEEALKSKVQADEVLRKWIRNGVLVEQTYKTPSRHAGTKLVPNEDKVAEILAATRAARGDYE